VGFRLELRLNTKDYNQSIRRRVSGLFDAR
jgi:hypothetical protein